MNICLKCYYYSRTRYGPICNKTGEYNPIKESCPHFISAEEKEKQMAAERKATSLILTMVDKLAAIDLKKLEKIEDAELKEQLFEICLLAKQIKRTLEG